VVLVTNDDDVLNVEANTGKLVPKVKAAIIVAAENFPIGII